MSASALLRPGPSASKPTGRDLPRPGRGPDHDQDESYFEAGRVDRAVHKMRAAVQKMTVALSSRKTRTPPEREREGRGLGTLMVWAVWRAKLRGLRFANSRARPKVPHGTSCSLLTRHHAQAPTVLDHPCALPQGDRSPRPALAGGEEGGERDLIVLDAGDMLHDAFARERLRSGGGQPLDITNLNTSPKITAAANAISQIRMIAPVSVFLLRRVK